MSETETLLSYTIKGTIVLGSFAFASIAAALLLNYFMGIVMSPDSINVLAISLVAMTPGGFYLGRAISHTFIINPIYEREEDSQEESLKIAEKTLLDLTDTLRKEQIKITESVGVLEFTANKYRLLLYVWFSGFAMAIVMIFIFFILSNLVFPV